MEKYDIILKMKIISQDHIKKLPSPEDQKQSEESVHSCPSSSNWLMYCLNPARVSLLMQVLSDCTSKYFSKLGFDDTTSHLNIKLL